MQSLVGEVGGVAESTGVSDLDQHIDRQPG